MKYISSCILLLCLGCVRPQAVTAPVPVATVVTVNEITLEAAKMSESDRMYAYKQYSGLSEFIRNSNVKSTNQIDRVLTNVQSFYGWQAGKYPGLTKVTANYLNSQGYENNKSLEDEGNRKWCADMFATIAESIKNVR